jgi:hypothetical protein
LALRNGGFGDISSGIVILGSLNNQRRTAKRRYDDTPLQHGAGGKLFPLLVA